MTDMFLPTYEPKISIVPTADWVLLGSGESNKGQELGRLYMQLVSRRILPVGRESVS